MSDVKQNVQEKRKTKGLSNKAQENLWGYIFILPNLIGFSVFTLFGIVFSLIMAFTNWNLIKGLDKVQFVGLDNFRSMVGDAYLTASLRNNAILLVVVPITLFLAAILAVVMNKNVYWKSGARALYFLPYITNTVAVSTVWQALLHQTKGPVNSLIARIFNLPMKRTPAWLSSTKWVLPALIIILIWSALGYDILMYSSALQSIPADYFEAAEIDGANAVQRFFYITVPLLQPMTFLLMILGVIGSLQMWSFVQLVTKGGPGTASYTIGLYIYRSGFQTYRTGYACALSWLLCGFILILTLIQWQGQKRFSID